MEEPHIKMKEAIDKNDISLIKALLKDGKTWLNNPVIQMTTDTHLGYVTPLFYAVSRNSYNSVVELIGQGSDLSILCNNETSLHKAIYLALYDIVKYLLVSGADIDQCLPKGGKSHKYTPLHYTTYHHTSPAIALGVGTTEAEVRIVRGKITELLLEMGARTDLIDDFNRTAVEIADIHFPDVRRPELSLIIRAKIDENRNHMTQYVQLVTSKLSVDKEKVSKLIQSDPKKFLSIIRQGWELTKWQYAFASKIFSTPTEVAALLKPFVGEQLTTLDLSNKRIDDTTIKMVVWLLQQNCFLRHLDLQNNNISTEGLKLLSTAIADHPQLELINIRNNPEITLSGIDDFLTILNSNYRLLGIHLPNHANSWQMSKVNNLCLRNEALAIKLRDYAKAGTVLSVQQLVLQGVNVHYKKDDALISATGSSCIEAVELLLMNGANPYLFGTGGVSAYQIAVERSDPTAEPTHYKAYIKILSLFDDHAYIRLQLARINILNQCADLKVPVAQLLAQFGKFSPTIAKAPEIPSPSDAPKP